MPVVDPRIAGKPVPRVSKETMEHECVARVKNVKALDVSVPGPAHSALRARHHQHGGYGRHRKRGAKAQRKRKRGRLLVANLARLGGATLHWPRP